MGEATMQRRSVLTALVGLVAAPAIIKVAGIMPVNAKLQPRGVGWNYNVHTGLWTEVVSYEPVIPQASVDVLYGSLQVGDTITWENLERGRDLRQFEIVADGTGSLPKGQRALIVAPRNLFLEHIDRRYHEQFGTEGAKIGTQLRIRLPNDFIIKDGPSLVAAQPDIALSAPAVAALGAAAVFAKNPTVSRRFWSR